MSDQRITFEFATRDDCLDLMVPSDLRVLVAERDRLRAKLEKLEHLGYLASIAGASPAQLDELRELCKPEQENSNG